MRQSYHGAADGFGFDPGAGGFEIGKPGPLFGGRQIPVGSVPAVAATADGQRLLIAVPVSETVSPHGRGELAGRTKEEMTLAAGSRLGSYCIDPRWHVGPDVGRTSWSSSMWLGCERAVKPLSPARDILFGGRGLRSRLGHVRSSASVSRLGLALSSWAP